MGIGTAVEDGEGVKGCDEGFAESEIWPYCCAADVPYIRIAGVVGCDIVYLEFSDRHQLSDASDCEAAAIISSTVIPY
jgi:hypothetical protein